MQQISPWSIYDKFQVQNEQKQEDKKPILSPPPSPKKRQSSVREIIEAQNYRKDILKRIEEEKHQIEKIRERQTLLMVIKSQLYQDKLQTLKRIPQIQKQYFQEKYNRNKSLTPTPNKSQLLHLEKQMDSLPFFPKPNKRKSVLLPQLKEQVTINQTDLHVNLQLAKLKKRGKNYNIDMSLPFVGKPSKKYMEDINNILE